MGSGDYIAQQIQHEKRENDLWLKSNGTRMPQSFELDSTRSAIMCSYSFGFFAPYCVAVYSLINKLCMSPNFMGGQLAATTSLKNNFARALLSN